MRKTSAVAFLILVALMLCYAGSTSTPVIAQYEVTTEGQYEPPPASTVPPPEETQYGAPAEDQNGGEENMGGTTAATTAPVDGGNEGDRNEGTPRNGPADRPNSADNALSRLLDGFLAEAAGLLVVLSLITTLLFFAERSSDRRGA